MSNGHDGVQRDPPITESYTVSSHEMTSSYGTSSTTDVAIGSSISVMAPASGKVKLDGSFTMNSAGGGGVITTASVYQSTASAPAQGSAPNTGDTTVLVTTRTRSTANEPMEASIAKVVSGLTPGVTYYFYKTLNSSSASYQATALASPGQNTIIGNPLPI